MPQHPEFSDILAAHKKIKPYIHQTPVLTSASLNLLVNAELYFKCENFQKAGAFKFRGATHAVLCLAQSELALGVATHSSGNHAAALARVALSEKIKCYVVMPNNAPRVKVNAVREYGAEIFFCEPTLKAREEGLQQVIKKTGSRFIHPYDNYNVICGQGTAVIELMNELQDLDIVMAPVGGGGLLSGTSIAAKHLNPRIRVIAGEPKNADDARRSFISGKLIPSEKPNTIADGLLTSLSQLTLGIIRNNVDDILTAKEETIIKAMRLIWERMKIIVEPSSAVPLAAILENPEIFKNQKIGIILSGGNVELSHLPF
ncbi:MAG: pyridoxal-phosphate dependent enzyme [Bacteroidales bacterium]|nr:pyridoxal-phosphate dependent enzyme [Bacteroidales bacterium]